MEDYKDIGQEILDKIKILSSRFDELFFNYSKDISRGGGADGLFK